MSVKSGFEIAIENNRVRKTPNNDVAIIDIIQNVLNVDSTDASQAWKRLKGNHSELKSFPKYAFGPGRPTDVGDFEHAVQVIMLLPGKVAAKVRADAARILARYLNADVTLADDIIARSEMIDSWNDFHLRMDMTLNKVPDGYFCVFCDAAPMIIPLIRNGLMVGNQTVPDISVGKAWSGYWKKQGLEEKFDAPIEFEHEYPEHYPQAASNPQTIKAYPEEAKGAFSKWMREIYLTEKLPKYLAGQVSSKKIPKELAAEINEVFNPKQIEQSEDGE